MDTTLSEKTPLEMDQGRKICFNPYLEEIFPNGIISNCVQCHKRAVYSPSEQSAKGGEGYELGLPPRCSETGAGPLPRCSKTDESYFHDVLQTDFIWSIPEAQDLAVRNLMDLVIKRFHELQLEDLRLHELKTAP